MIDGRSDEASPASEPEPQPDWVAQAPKPIELPPVDEAEEAKRPGPGRGGATPWLVLVLVLAVALVGSSPYWAPAVAMLLPWAPGKGGEPLAQLDQRVGDLARRQEEFGQSLAALDQRLARLEEQLRGAGGAGGAASAVKALDERVAALEQRPQAADPARLSQLQDEIRRLAQGQEQSGERIAKLEARRGTAAGERSDQALLVALGQLRGQIQGSGPFAAELGAIEALVRDQPEIRDALQPLAASANAGIPSLAVLTQRFSQETAPALLHEAAPKGEGWGDQMMGRLRSLVTIRRVGRSGGVSDDPVEAAVARTEAALAGGDLAGAVKAVEALPENTQAPAKPWLDDARKRLGAEQALARITGELTARLAAEDRTAAPGSGDH